MNYYKKMRLDAGLTIPEAAEKFECSESMIYGMESDGKNYRRPGIEIGQRMSEIYNCTLEIIYPKNRVGRPKKDSTRSSNYKKVIICNK